MREYQTIIIGAGPAGLMAGKHLENSLILDKKREIGEPVQCGEGISRKSLIKQGLIKQGIKLDPAWLSCPVYTALRIMPNGQSFGRRYQEPLGYIIDRVAFEKSLAKESQAEIKLNCQVVKIERLEDVWQIKTKDGQTFKSKYLIGADGVNSIVRKKVFPENERKTELIPAIEYLVELEKQIDTERLAMYFDNQKYSQGYAWFFPKSKQTANIGLCGKNIRLAEKFEELLATTIKKTYGSYRLLKNKSGLIPLTQKGGSFFKNNAFLVGDAAGLVDPLFKGGIGQALQSGKIAADSILENEAGCYEAKLKEIFLINEKILKASNLFYSFDNQVLNELAEVLEGKGTSYLKTFSGFKDLLLKPNLRKNIRQLFLFFRIWWKNRDYLW